MVATMPVDERHRRPSSGTCTAGSAWCSPSRWQASAATSTARPGKAAFGAEISASHVRPKRSGTLTAVGTPAHVGRRTQVWEVHITDEDEKTVCISRCTVAVVDAE